ncbi:MAG: hydroxymethylglutaryl-CoA synthase [Thermoplasmata archaeon]|nr:hydroxymethylglutaryl-CoA synthase [Thermoplasmata archaeon]
MVGIVTYGSYIPRYRIKVEEIARVWGEDPEDIKNGLYIYSKSVPGPDEDTATISVEALRNAMARKRPIGVGAVYVGSESHPYAVKPTATIVAEAAGLAPEVTAADYEFACKAGTAAMQTVMGMVKSGMIREGVAIGADTSQGAPGDALEFSAAAGGTAFVIGNENVIAEIKATYSITTDTPDFWRRESQDYPRHGGRFTGEPAYFRHVLDTSRKIMEIMKTKPEDYTYAVFHQPNGKFPSRAAKILGFKESQIKQGLIVPYIGNTYSGSMITGLSAILDISKPGDRILAVSFGSGAGSDAFHIEITNEMENFSRENAPAVWNQIERAKYIDYAYYAKFKKKIKMGE